MSWLVDGGVNRKRFVECKPVDVTTLRATPRVPLKAIPSSTFVRVNGGAFRNPFSWRRSLGRTTPNRWLSVSRPVGPRSKYRRFRSFQAGDLPPPRAQENVAEKARPRSRASAEMGRSTDADGERECARASPLNPLHRPLDKRCFIDGGRRTCLVRSWRCRSPTLRRWQRTGPLTLELHNATTELRAKAVERLYSARRRRVMRVSTACSGWTPSKSTRAMASTMGISTS